MHAASIEFVRRRDSGATLLVRFCSRASRAALPTARPPATAVTASQRAPAPAAVSLTHLHARLRAQDSALTCAAN